MGHSSSKELSESNQGSRHSRLKKKLHLHAHSLHLRRTFHRNGFASGSYVLKLASAEDFVGIALLTHSSAEMKFKDKWTACVSLGEQTFRTEISDQLNNFLLRISDI